mgnify:FL=1
MMKKILLILAILFSTLSYSQLTDANFQQAINACLSTNPEDGMCSDSEYGAMPDWDVSKVTDMDRAFDGRDVFNVDISNWDVSNVTNMSSMFINATSFNQPLNNWNVSNVTNMFQMFTAASVFNQDLNSWDVSSVTNMSSMFFFATSFNQPLNNWDISSVTDMQVMFGSATSFNQPLNNWNVSNVTNMFQMFTTASVFNQDLNSWDVSSVTNMSSMFFYATSFNQSLNNWDISSVTDMQEMFSYSSLSTDNYDGVLNSWSQQDVISGVILRAIGVNYCNGEDARQNLIDTYGWIITDDGLDCATAGVDDQNQLDISIYPNPTSDIIYIDGNYSQLKAVVYDILGKQVMNKPITNSIDISQLDKGVYILKLSDGVKLTTQRILKN